MASSSMCGPSNPLQSLKNHTSFDRSLQQDRFRSSSQPSSQFRQQTRLTAQPHDEFEQFLSTSPSPSQTLQTLQTRPSLQNFAAAPSPALQQQPWAADFQRLQISTPPPLQAHKAPIATGWRAEFLSQMTASPATSSISQQKAPILGGNSYMGMNTGYMGVSPLHSYDPVQTNYTESITTSSYTDAEFDQMFEEAATQFQTDVIDFPQREVPNPLLNTNRSQIEEVKPEEVVEEEKDRSRNDADELARTAGQLVDTLSQDTSRKFQESQFVALMRKLRDKTVKVEDGKMVEV